MFIATEDLTEIYDFSISVGPNGYIYCLTERRERPFNDRTNMGDLRFYRPRKKTATADRSVFAPVKPARRSSGKTKFYASHRTENRRKLATQLLRSARRS